MSTSPYFKELRAQPGVRIDLEPPTAFELSAVADQVVGTVARLARGPIDRPFLVTRQDLEVRTGLARSNLVRAIHEARMQMADVMDSGGAGIVVARLVPATAVKRYVSVSLGGAGVVSVVNVTAAPALINEGSSVSLTVQMSGSGGATGIPFSISGVSPLDIDDPVFGSGVTLVGGELTVPAGVSTFGITIPVLADQLTEGAESLTVEVGGISRTISVNDTSLSPPPPAFVIDQDSEAGWMHPTNQYGVPYIIPESGMLLMHPGPGMERPTLAFTNTFGAGTFNFTVSTQQDEQADGNYIDVVRGGSVIGSADVSSWDSSLALSSGEVIEFTLAGSQYHGGGRYVVVSISKVLSSGPVPVADAYADFMASNGRPTATWAYFYRSNINYPNGALNSAGPMLPIGQAPQPATVQSVASGGNVYEGGAAIFTVQMSTTAGALDIPFSISGVSAGDIGTLAFSNGVTRNGSLLTVPAGVYSFTITVPVLSDGVPDSGETMALTVGGASASVLVDDAAADPILAMSPALWIDPSDAATLTTAGNTVIGPTINAITDKSGNGRDLTRTSNSIAYPALRSTQLGLGGISLQAGGFNIGGAALSLSEYTVYAVVFIDAHGNFARSITFIANGQVHVGCSAAMIFTSGVLATPGLQVASPTNYAYTQGVAAFATGRAHVVTLKRKSNWANSELSRNGVDLTVYSNGGSGGSAVFNVVGNQSSYTSSGWDLGEMVVVPRITSEAEDAAVEAYLMNKWGVS